jgi:hypothetical protein
MSVISFASILEIPDTLSPFLNRSWRVAAIASQNMKTSLALEWAASKAQSE